jgi:hypothetical protein
MNDFPAFYVASERVGSGNLYDPAAFLAEQNRILGRNNRTIVFIRLPHVAVLLAPMRYLSYPVAYALWQALSFAALGIFAVLWPARRPLAFVICCWFPPVAATLANGQDLTYLLLWVVLAIWLERTGSEFSAGLVLSLCAAKPHLFVFLPLVFIAKRKWRVGGGFCAGAGAILLVSFLAAGLRWPLDFLTATRDPAVHPKIGSSSLMAYLASVLHGPALWALGGVIVIALAVMVYRVAGTQDFATAIAVACAAGPIVAFHVYAQDYLVTLPLVLILVTRLLERSGSAAIAA